MHKKNYIQNIQLHKIVIIYTRYIIMYNYIQK